MATDASGLPTLGWGGIVWPGRAVAPDIDKELGPAEQYGVGPARVVQLVDGAIVASGPFPQALAGHSSAALEVLSGLRVLKAVVLRAGAAAVRGKRVRWYCDASVAVDAVRVWKARAPGLAQAVLKLLTFVRTHGIVLEPIWVSRALGWQPAVDFLSKLRWRRGTAEWAVARSVIRDLVLRAGWEPEIDLFAAPGNQQCSEFATRYPYAGAWCDAFSFSWADKRLFAFPPFAVVNHVLSCLGRCRGARMLLIAPADVHVPAHIRVFFRSPLVSSHLRDVQGHVPRAPCPRPLVALCLGSPEHGGS